jgi:hypothetical protein
LCSTKISAPKTMQNHTYTPPTTSAHAFVLQQYVQKRNGVLLSLR